MIQKTIEDLVAMQRLAECLASFLFPGFVLCLSGDLGAGKTTFTQFLGRAMGIEETIQSPTFTLMKSYPESPLELVHIDAYRLEALGGDPSLEEAIDQAEVAVIEWYEYIAESLPDTYLAIQITHAGGQRRYVTIEGRGPYAKIAQALNT